MDRIEYREGIIYYGGSRGRNGVRKGYTCSVCHRQ